MLPRARSWVGWDAPAPCVVRECAGASLETGSFKTRLGPSGPRARTERTCFTCVLNWSVYWDCVLVVCPTWIRVSGSLLCVWRALPTELCVWRSRVCRRQECLVKYLGIQRQDGNGEWCPLSVTWGVFTSVVAAVWRGSCSSLAGHDAAPSWVARRGTSTGASSATAGRCWGGDAEERGHRWTLSLGVNEAAFQFK